MPRVFMPADNLICSFYQKGNTILETAKKFNISHSYIKKVLKRNNASRTISEAHKLKFSKMTKTEKINLSENARQARLLAITPEALSKKAKTKEGQTKFATADQLLIFNKLKEFNPILEFAIERYNVDIAIPSKKIAIEIDGGNWHHSSEITKHRDRTKEAVLIKNDFIIIRISSSNDLDYLISSIQRICTFPLHIG